MYKLLPFGSRISICSEIEVSFGFATPTLQRFPLVPFRPYVYDSIRNWDLPIPGTAWPNSPAGLPALKIRARASTDVGQVNSSSPAAVVSPNVFRTTSGSGGARIDLSD